MVKVYIIESESGWDQKTIAEQEFGSYDEALLFAREFNSRNDIPYVPDWYMFAQIEGEGVMWR